MTNHQRSISVIAVALGIAAATLFLFDKAPSDTESKTEEKEIHQRPERQIQSTQIKPRKKVATKFAKDLSSPEGTVTDDLKILKNIFFQLRTIARENPVGNHQEIVACLTGNNPANIAYVSQSHPSIRGGKLHDRWGEPYYFHQISASVMEIRSAGPDGVHWNEDDVIIR